MQTWTIVLIVVAALAVVLAAASIRIVREYQRLVVFRLGRLRGARGPGLVVIIQAAERLSQAAHVIPSEHGALTLRRSRRWRTGHNSTLVLPIPWTCSTWLARAPPRTPPPWRPSTERPFGKSEGTARHPADVGVTRRVYVPAIPTWRPR